MLRVSSLLVVLTVGCVATTTHTADESDRVDAPLLRKLVEAPCRNEDPETASVRRSIERIRAMTGLPSLHCDAKTETAARAHCRYVADNHVVSHIEERTKLHFYGEHAADRMKRAGATDAPAGEVLATLRSTAAIESPVGWMNSVYHRSLFLRRETTSFGYGAAEDCATIDFGREDSASKGAAVVWPPNGARDVPPSFAAENEIPNPVPGHTLVGAPISVVGTDAISSPQAHVRGPHGEVATKLLTSATDPAKLVRVGEVHVVPLAPLAAGTTYTATITGRVGNRPVQYTTTFTTADN